MFLWDVVQVFRICIVWERWYNNKLRSPMMWRMYLTHNCLIIHFVFRYWNKPVWSAVYLVLLNYSAFASLIPAPGDGHERGESAGAGAVKLLQSVLAAVRGLLATESASAVKQVSTF